MELLSLNCPKCGGELNVKPKGTEIFCSYCGNKFAIPKDLTNDKQIENFLKMGYDAIGLSQSKEAISYFNKVLELDNKNPDASVGKGFALFLSSTLAVDYTVEMAALFKETYSWTPNERKKEIGDKIKRYSLEASSTFFELSKQHFREYKGKFTDMENMNRLYDEFYDWVIKSIGIIDVALNIGTESKDLDSALARHGIYIVDNCSGVISNNAQKTQKQKYISIIQKYDPTYVTSTDAEGCFVATAVYGDYDDPQVWVLRNFRDSFLLRSEWGNKFVKFYYRISPGLVCEYGERKTLLMITKAMLTGFISILKLLGYSQGKQPIDP